MGRNGHDGSSQNGYEAMARLCFSRLRFLPGGLRERLRSEGIWEDLVQEIRLRAWIAWREGMETQDALNYAGSGVYDFMKQYGYVPSRHGYHRLEVALSCFCEDRGLPLAGVPTDYVDQENLEEDILRLVRRYPDEGLPRSSVCNRLKIPARVLDRYAARLAERGLIRIVLSKRNRGNAPGRRLVPVDAEATTAAAR